MPSLFDFFTPPPRMTERRHTWSGAAWSHQRCLVCYRERDWLDLTVCAGRPEPIVLDLAPGRPEVANGIE